MNRLNTPPPSQLLKLTVVLILSGTLAAAPAGCTGDQTGAIASASSLIEAAVETAKAENKAILVDFGASWCSWCKRFDKALSSAELGKLFTDNYVIVKLAAQEDKTALENPGATDMMLKEGGSGLPFYMFLDQTGTKIADSMAMPKQGNIGYPATAEEIRTFGALIRKSAPRVTEAQHDTILNYLEKNAPK